MSSELIILHLDMDSFYASIEIRDNPALSGKPVVIGADPRNGKGRGVVSTCSYEARNYGIYSGMPISRAFHLCPGAVYLPPMMDTYAAESRKIMHLLEQETGDIEQVSIDEAYIDLTTDYSYEKATLRAIAIKNRIAGTRHLTCSIGIAPSRIYAKMASEQQKPNGLVIVKPEGLASFLRPLPTGAIPGIGKKSVDLLTAYDMKTIRDLADADIQFLQDIFGSQAVRIHAIACGQDREGLRLIGHQRSLGRDHTFPADTSNQEVLQETLRQMLLSVCCEMEEKNIFCRSVGIRIRYSGFETKTRTLSRDRPTHDFRVLSQNIDDLFRETWTGRPVRLIGIKISGLSFIEPVQSRLHDFIGSDPELPSRVRNRINQ